MIHRCLGITGSIMAQLENVWRQQRHSLSIKLNIYTSLVQSVVFYGSDNVDSDRIQSFHMQALHRILGVRQGIQCSNQWENETIRLAVSYCWQKSFIIWSHLSPTREHTCFAGTATVNRSPHLLTNATLRRWLEASAVCRPWKTWLQQVEEDIGLSVGAAQIASQDRSMWSMLRPSAGQLHQWLSECWLSCLILPYI